nr:hypothetical protein [Tanacetum cinerariifolium]
MSTQQDIYAAGSENRLPMLNKDYISWSSRLLRYANSKPNIKLLVNSIKNGLYVRRIIHEPGDPNGVPPIAESTHEQTNDERTEKEAKQMEAGDQTIQTILMGLLEDICAAEKKTRFFSEWEKFNSTEGESIVSYYQRFSKLKNDFSRNEHFPRKIASNLKFLSSLQPEWKRYCHYCSSNKDLCKEDYTKLYDLLKFNQSDVVEIRAERLANTHGIANQNANKNRNGNLVAARAKGNVRPRRRDAAYLQTQLLIAQKEEAGIQLQA